MLGACSPTRPQDTRNIVAEPSCDPRPYGRRVAYDVLAQSIALIESRELPRVERLSRRQRFVAMSVDVDDRAGLAVTSFARRGVSCTWRDTHVLTRRKGQWVLLGGGGNTGGDEDLLADRPPVPPDGPTSRTRPGSSGYPAKRSCCRAPMEECSTARAARAVGRGRGAGSATTRSRPAQTSTR